MSRLKLSLFPKTFIRSKILQNIASLVQDFAQNHHFGSPLTLFPNTFTRSQILIKIIVILVHCGRVHRGKFYFFRKKLFFAKTFTQSKILIKFVILVHYRHFSQIFLTRSQILLEIVILVQCGHVQAENCILSKNFCLI